MIPWHRLFGLTLTDYFLDTAYEVELEKDLSLKQQLLDVVIIEKKEGKSPESLPDGLEILAAHNLMTYKSHQDRLDGWAIEELCGHYVNYRKQISPSLERLPPAEDFSLFAVTARYPEKLAKRVDLAIISPGVYDVRWGIRDVRIIVLSRIIESPKNAPWLMFSADADKVRYGAARYEWKSPVSGILNKLLKNYQSEGVVMPYTMEDFQKEVKEEVLRSLTEEELDRLLNGMKPEKAHEGIEAGGALEGVDIGRN
jgi:hypothetical protein